MKLMPDSPSTDLAAIEKTAEEIITSQHKTLVKIEEQPIAFGLKAIILSFAWNDEIEIEPYSASTITSSSPAVFGRVFSGFF